MSWYEGRFYQDDLVSLQSLCLLSDSTKASMDYIKSFKNIPTDETNYTIEEVILGAYYTAFYNCNKDVCQCNDLSILDQIASANGVVKPINPFPQQPGGGGGDGGSEDFGGIGIMVV